MRAVSLAVGALLAAPLGAALGYTGEIDGHYITYEDAEAVDKAEDAVGKFCTFDTAENAKDAADARESLVGAVGDRPIYNAMITSEDNDEFGKRTQEILERQVVSSIGMAAILSVISFLLCFCCTWSTCPCYKNVRCCRPCAAVRENGIPHKVCAIIPVALASLLTIVGVATSSGGSSTMIAGFDALACESAELLSSTLQGQGGPLAFIGLIPALENFRSVEDAMGDNSDFIRDLKSTLDETKIVSDAITIATSALTTLGGVLDYTATYIETTSESGYETTYRKCEFCTTLTGILSEASDGLENGVGQALANARNEVDKQLSPEKRVDLKRLIRDSSDPMIKMKEAFIGMAGSLIDFSEEDTFDMIKEYVPMAVSLVFMGAFITLIFASCSTACCLVKEKMADDSYNKAPHRFACCSFISAFPFAILCFILGGILTGVTTPVADLCLILDDLDGQMVKDARGALFDSTSGEDADAEAGIDGLAKLIDNCINPVNKTLNAKFLDLIEIDDENGEKKTMGEVLKDTVTAPIDSTFAAIGSNSGNITMADSEPILKLLNAVKGNPIEKVIRVDAEAIGGNTDYSPLGSPSNAEAIQKALAATLACPDHPMEIEGQRQTLPGLTAFVAAFEGTFTTASSATPINVCAATQYQPRDCSGENAADKLVCDAGNKYMKLFEALVGKLQFRCDIWEDAQGNDCDIKDAVWIPTPNNLCIQSDGTLQKKEKFCNWDEFKTYYLDSETRLKKAFEYVDYAVAQKQSTISTTLKNLVYRDFITPMFTVFDGMSCGFMPGFWQAVIDSLCFQGVYGVRRIGQGYSLTAFFMLILGICMYFVWRRTIDNVNKSQEGASPGVEASM